MKTRLLLAVAALAVAACDNPAKDKAQATVAAPVDSSAAAQTAPAGAVVFAITPQNSKVEWTGSKVTGSEDGSFGAFTGEVDVVDNAPEKSRVSVDIDATSLAAQKSDKLTGHLKSPDFFDVAKFPKASFFSTSIKAGGEKGATHTVTGNLELHGVKKAITFPATIAIAADAVTASATFTINRKDFGVNYPGKADDLIRDDVVIKLTIHADKKKG
jgi:polyisoprenoid-binding protein YceI